MGIFINNEPAIYNLELSLPADRYRLYVLFIMGKTKNRRKDHHSSDKNLVLMWLFIAGILASHRLK